MSHRPFHHGNLRAALLDQAEVTLQERGADELSLRELARAVGVSHGAPRSHFIDRSALLVALAERGFTRLRSEMDAAVAEWPDDLAAAARAASTAYVRFALDHPALLELMFATKVQEASPALHDAAQRVFDVFGTIMRRGLDAGLFPEHEFDRRMLLAAATLQGICTLSAGWRITRAQVDTLIEDLVQLVLMRSSASSPGAG